MGEQTPIGFTRRNAILCNDGETASIQASCANYSTPKKCGVDIYDNIEAGFPSVYPPQSWMKYCEDSTDPLNTVYPFMPAQLVWEFVQEHGGLSDISAPLDFIWFPIS